MEDVSIENLTSEQIEEICVVAEEAAKKYVQSRISVKYIDVLNISVEVEGTGPIVLTVDADIALSHEIKGFDTQKLIDEAADKAFISAERYLGKLGCLSQK